MERYLGESIPKLGFGFMRLPKQADGKIDLEQTKDMVDAFLQAGQTYFDTAYVYDGGDSERAIKAALVDRYPRESFQLATKLCAWMGAEDEQAAKQQFYTSLERTGAGYFDFYLLHALQPGTYQMYEKFHIWDFVREQKAKGLIRHWGFSFHATPEILDEVLTAHPDAEFVQLQINYADWENPNVAARANYEVARRHNKPVIIMEPVKGGLLANPPETVAQVLKAAAPEKDLPSWALRFAASLEGIITVLSGMSTLEQMEQNLATMKEFSPLSAQEQAVVAQAREALVSLPSIPCTSCQYCVKGCPQGIPIPGVFSAMNTHLIYGNTERAKGNYGFATRGKGKASDCIQCGQCESVCPQHISIIQQLQQAAEVLE